MPRYEQKRADDLVKGDYLPLTNARVIAVHDSGLRTPSGKIELTIEGTRGRRTVTWGKRTLISVDNSTQERGTQCPQTSTK